MTLSAPILLRAVVAATEEPALRSAAEKLSSSLSAAAGEPFDFRCAFVGTIEAFEPVGEASIVITSFLSEVDGYEEPWPHVERRLRSAYATLSRRENLVVFVCTVLRHIARDGDTERAQARRIRIRRLNLFAAELSREMGIYVIDLDRALADVGARALETDYRLAGHYAAEAAAKCIALTLLAVGLDAYASFEVQDAAKAIVARYELPRATPAVTSPEMPYNVIAMGVGRRTQFVAPVYRAAQEHQAWLVRSLLTCKISFPVAWAKLLDSVGRRGVKSSVKIFISGIRTLLRDNVRTGR
jgi:hypothetical protein